MLDEPRPSSYIQKYIGLEGVAHGAGPVASPLASRGSRPEARGRCSARRPRRAAASRAAGHGGQRRQARARCAPGWWRRTAAAGRERVPVGGEDHPGKAFGRPAVGDGLQAWRSRSWTSRRSAGPRSRSGNSGKGRCWPPDCPEAGCPGAGTPWSPGRGWGTDSVRLGAGAGRRLGGQRIGATTKTKGSTVSPATGDGSGQGESGERTCESAVLLYPLPFLDCELIVFTK